MKKIRYLITGSGGTIGSALLDKLMSKNNVTVCAFDSDEERLFNISEKYSTSRNNLHLFLGNIRDKQRLLLAMENIDVVFHCAALKHVYINEYNPFEVKKTNIDGVENIIDCAIEHKVNKVIFTSSDKAVNPINIMGASKMMGERLFISANNRVGMGPTIFSCVRFGNVIDSSGSVLQTFRKQINNNIPLTITDKRMTRFIITLNNAIDLCFYAERNMKGGEIFIKNMGSINITDLAIAFSKKSNPSIKYIGIKEGEKLYEELLTAEEASRAYVHEGFICILPELINKSLSIKQKKKFQDIAKNRLKFTKELRSDQKLLSLTNIRNLLSSCYAKKKIPNYDEVSYKTWIYQDLKKKNLEHSISLFDFKKKIITPKKLDVIALLSGLPFSKKLINKISYTQKYIDRIIGNVNRYWVKKDNLGIEFCVFKWPDEELDKINMNEIVSLISKLNIQKFKVLFDGCQLNPDGCIIIKGFDVSNKINYIRNLISKNIRNLPKKQSSWYHIPIGRILEPVGTENFLKLKNFFNKNFNGWKHYEKIKTIKLIHEYQWYMEKRKILISVKNK